MMAIVMRASGKRWKMPENNTPTPEDRRQTVAVILAAYVTAQGALAILKMTGTIEWSWAAVLVPSYIIAAVYLFVIVLGTVLGIRDYKRKRRTKDEIIQKALEKRLEDFIRSLNEEDDEEDKTE